jgi:hypothetical protein
LGAAESQADSLFLPEHPPVAINQPRPVLENDHDSIGAPLLVAEHGDIGIVEQWHWRRPRIKIVEAQVIGCISAKGEP